jgi:hypothetical protein
LAAVVAVSLAGCGGDPESTPTPTPSATATPTPTPTPTPSPTVPVPAEHDPAWTPDQLDAVRLVEAYNSLYMTMCKDPLNDEHWATMLKIAGDPLLSRWADGHEEFRDSGQRFSEEADIIVVAWSVDPVRDVDGRQEIELSWCSTATLARATQADGQVVELAPTQTRRYGTAQLIPNVGWRLIDRNGGTEPC